MNREDIASRIADVWFEVEVAPSRETLLRASDALHRLASQVEQLAEEIPVNERSAS